MTCVTMAGGASGMGRGRLVDTVVPGQARLLMSAGRSPAKYAGILIGLQSESQHAWQAPLCTWGSQLCRTSGMEGVPADACDCGGLRHTMGCLGLHWESVACSCVHATE